MFLNTVFFKWLYQMNIYLTKSLKNKKRKKDYCDQIGKMGKTGQKKNNYLSKCI